MGLLDEIRRHPLLGQMDPRAAANALTGMPVPTGNLARGVGQGIGNQLSGISQAISQPGALYQQSMGFGRQMAADPKGVAKGLLADAVQRARSGPLGLGELIGENLSLRPRVPRKGLLEMTTYHGSPHRFDPEPDAPLGKFRLEKIGTGEGAQAYGHGIYLAENPSVAGSYRTAGNAQHATIDGKPMAAFWRNRPERGSVEDLADWIDSYRTRDAVRTAMGGRRQDLLTLHDELEAAGRIKYSTGNLYNVDLPDEQIGKMLDWDAPVSEAPPAFQQAIAGLARYRDPYVAAKSKIGEAYRELSGSLGGADKASAALLAAGIPGIKYFDGGSRGGGKGTRNFVLFDPEIAKIIGRE